MSIINHYKREWDMNASGIYYRHHSSPDWSKDLPYKLYMPSLSGLNPNDVCETARRQRARVLSSRARNNEKWNKSEYAWEADAWSDVFGQMRNDPVLVA